MVGGQQGLAVGQAVAGSTVADVDGLKPHVLHQEALVADPLRPGRNVGWLNDLGLVDPQVLELGPLVSLATVLLAAALFGLLGRGRAGVVQRTGLALRCRRQPLELVDLLHQLLDHSQQLLDERRPLFRRNFNPELFQPP